MNVSWKDWPADQVFTDWRAELPLPRTTQMTERTETKVRIAKAAPVRSICRAPRGDGSASEPRIWRIGPNQDNGADISWFEGTRCIGCVGVSY